MWFVVTCLHPGETGEVNHEIHETHERGRIKTSAGVDPRDGDDRTGNCSRRCTLMDADGNGMGAGMSGVLPFFRISASIRVDQRLIESGSGRGDVGIAVLKGGAFRGGRRGAPGEAVRERTTLAAFLRLRAIAL